MLHQSRSIDSTSGYVIGSGARSSKSTSLSNHNVPSLAASKPHRLRTHRQNQVNIIPFPTAMALASSSARPLPNPPRPHPLIRVSPCEDDLPRLIRVRKGSLVSSPAPLLPKSPLGSFSNSLAVPLPLAIERRRSRDSNVADRLVIEVDDVDDEIVAARLNGKVVVEDDEDDRVLPLKVDQNLDNVVAQVLQDVVEVPKRSSSPTTPTSPESNAPPAYSTLPPPYSASDYQDVKDVDAKIEVEVPIIQLTPEKEEPPIVAPIPTRTHKPSISAGSAGPSTSKRTRVSTSELKVLVYLYRTVVYGLEMRRRREERERQQAKASRASSRAASPTLRQKKPQGPRASPSPPKTTLPPPESKSQLETALLISAASASPSMLLKGKEKAQELFRGFGAFPLVEEDEGVFDEDEDYIVPRTPVHTPSQSPRSTSPPIASIASTTCSQPPSASSSRTATPAPSKKEKSKADVNAELDVQDALLAIRLREFLRAQGVCEGDLRVEVENDGVEEPVEVEKAPVEEQPQEEEGGNILDEYFMGIEEEEDTSDSEGSSSRKSSSRGVLVEEEDSSPPQLPIPIPVAAPAKLTPPIMSIKTTEPSRMMVSPPPTSPSPRPRAVLPTSYMVALLMMRMRHPSRRPSSSNSSSGSEKSGKARSRFSNEEMKRKSGLRVIVEVD